PHSHGVAQPENQRRISVRAERRLSGLCHRLPRRSALRQFASTRQHAARVLATRRADLCHSLLATAAAARRGRLHPAAGSSPDTAISREMTEQAPASEAVAQETVDLRSRILRNTGAQMVGRVVIALSRLAVAAIIVRVFGAATFGEYGLILSFLAVAEWLV